MRIYEYVDDRNFITWQKKKDYNNQNMENKIWVYNINYDFKLIYPLLAWPTQSLVFPMVARKFERKQYFPRAIHIAQYKYKLISAINFRHGIFNNIVWQIYSHISHSWNVRHVMIIAVS